MDKTNSDILILINKIHTQEWPEGIDIVYQIFQLSGISLDKKVKCSLLHLPKKSLNENRFPCPAGFLPREWGRKPTLAKANIEIVSELHERKTLYIHRIKSPRTCEQYRESNFDAK